MEVVHSEKSARGEKKYVSVYDYVYQYKDHLGNVRLSYADTDSNGSVDSSEIKEENNYYPFGLQHKGYNNTRTADHPYTFLGQEKNEELGLNWLTFRYRNYMPEIGRFFGVDPVSSEYMSISTFQFAHNNPVWKIEIEGLEGESTTQKDVINNEPVRTVSEARIGSPVVVGTVATTQAVSQVQKSTLKLVAEEAARRFSWQTIGGTIVTGVRSFGLPALALLSPTSMGPGMTMTHTDSNGRIINNVTGQEENNPMIVPYAIDEVLKVDDYLVRSEDQNDSPVRRLGINKVDKACDAPNGCEKVADKVVGELGEGASYLQITPRFGNRLGPVNGEDSDWFWHVAAFKNGVVYDRLTGDQGMKLEDYKKLFDYNEDLNFDPVKSRTLE